jgi:hypothetical protein
MVFFQFASKRIQMLASGDPVPKFRLGLEKMA